jgi:catechol 2,3-dioxygenase-like lactoylglutathione lyase family enzyme
MGAFIAGIDHIAFQLTDLQEGLRFFNGLLGFKIKLDLDFERTRIVILKAGKVEIEMWENGGAGLDGSPPADVPGTHHIAIAVKNLDQVMAVIREQGYETVKDIYEPTRGIREAIIRGPDGIRIQFVEQRIPTLIWRSLKGDFND